jgi:hypothetical protein
MHQSRLVGKYRCVRRFSLFNAPHSFVARTFSSIAAFKALPLRCPRSLLPHHSFILPALLHYPPLALIVPHHSSAPRPFRLVLVHCTSPHPRPAPTPALPFTLSSTFPRCLPTPFQWLHMCYETRIEARLTHDSLMVSPIRTVMLAKQSRPSKLGGVARIRDAPRLLRLSSSPLPLSLRLRASHSSVPIRD